MQFTTEYCFFSHLLLTKSTVAVAMAIAFLDTDTQYFKPWSSGLTQSITYVEVILLAPSADTLLLISWTRVVSSWIYRSNKKK